jgi:hypothetical protein
MLRRALIFALLFLIAFASNAQFNFNKYERGSYYDNNGSKHTGIIHFKTNRGEISKVEFQKDSIDTPQKLSLNDVQSVVLIHRPCPEDSVWGVSNTDSLVVLQWRKDKFLAKYVTTLQGTKIFGHVFSSSSGNSVYREYYTATNYEIVENGAILDYHDDDSVNWKGFYSKKFSKYPDVVAFIQQIKKKEPSIEDISAIVKYITHHYPLK